VKLASVSRSAELERNGFAVVPALVGARTVSKLIEAIAIGLDSAGPRSSHALRHLTQVVPAVKELAEAAEIRSLVESLLGTKPFVVRSLFFDKTPEANWKVAWHQDLTIAVQQRIETAGFGPWSTKEGVVHVQPPAAILEQMLTVRLHLDDCGPENGPVQVLPGSHQSGTMNGEQISKFRKRTAPVICTIESGGAVVMRPLLLHASSPAAVPGHRRVIHLEFAAQSLPGRMQWAVQSYGGASRLGSSKVSVPAIVEFRD
jgi:ectoine hydroxylase-related dioxygenase (phytanoyl-CoA dioxygenase family)